MYSSKRRIYIISFKQYSDFGLEVLFKENKKYSFKNSISSGLHVKNTKYIVQNIFLDKN